MIAFVLFTAILLTLSVVPKGQNIVFEKAEKGVLVTSIPFQDDNFIYSGGNYYSVINKQDIGKILQAQNKIEGFKGLNLYFNETISLQKLKKQIDFLSEKSVINGQEIYTGYSENFDNFVWIEGKKVNLQIASTQNGFVVGIPLILTGF